MNEVGGSSLRSRANASNSAWVTLDQMGGSLKVTRWLHSSRFAEMHCRLGGRWGPASNSMLCVKPALITLPRDTAGYLGCALMIWTNIKERS